MVTIYENSSDPIFYCDWGTGYLEAYDNNGLALSWIKAHRSNTKYRDILSRIYMGYRYSLNPANFRFREHLDGCPLFLDFFDPNKWYHRWEPLTKTAGGFDISSDITNNHGPLCAAYTIQKEGDTPGMFSVLPAGLAYFGRPDWGSWGGRFSEKTGQKPDKYYHCNAEDSWNGSTNRDNTLKRWAVHLQNDFKARADWCVKSYDQANHHPVAAFDGNTSNDFVRITTAPGKLPLDASASSDPDGDALGFEWVYYRECGSYAGEIKIENRTKSTATATIPANALGKDFHIILCVTDKGSPALTDYRRIIVSVSDENQSPQLQFKKPADNAVLQASAGVGIEVEASDPDGSVAKVEFFVDGSSVGTDNSAPYEATTPSLTEGTHTIKAVATDNEGNAAEASITVSVLPEGAVAITNLSASSGAAYEMGLLNTGEKQYIDRDYTFSSVPSDLAGLQYFRTANDDKSASDADFLSFSVNEPVTVYVAYDSRISTKPSWLSGFAQTGMQLEAGGGAFDVLSKNFDAGTVTLGGNECFGQCSMYSVVVGAQTDDPVVAISRPGLVQPAGSRAGLRRAKLFSLDGRFRGEVRVDRHGNVVGAPQQLGSQVYLMRFSDGEIAKMVTPVATQ